MVVTFGGEGTIDGVSTSTTVVTLGSSGPVVSSERADVGVARDMECNKEGAAVDTEAAEVTAAGASTVLRGVMASTATAGLMPEDEE